MDELEVSVKKELTENILPFWERYGRDLPTGGFYGFLGNDNRGDPSVSRSVVMTSRHLWAYSAAARSLGDASYLGMADYAFRALARDFIDGESGGVFWSVTAHGVPDIAKKQVYGEAFAMYALSEYALALADIRSDATGAESALSLALSTYVLLEANARDRVHGGYVEARARDWSATSDLKLSEKDIDCGKSMNTNLHMMEALATLLRAVKALRPIDRALRTRIGESLAAAIAAIHERVLREDGHLGIYFNDDWAIIGDGISYGHDIEASWLLWEAVSELGVPALIALIRPGVVRIAEVALAEGTDPVSGAIESDLRDGHKDRTRVWWCQAEALVGYFNAWELTGDEKFLDAARRQWSWIENFQRDRAGGDWFAAVGPDGKPDPREAKGGNWKASYHNGRCCLEILGRIARLRAGTAQ